MKRVLAFGLLLVLLVGCTPGEETAERVMLFRQKLQENGFSFTATVTSDYGSGTQTFVLRCEGDRGGSLRFEVLSPETIQGITGIIDADGGSLHYEDMILAFEPLADGQLAPVTAPWVLIHTLRSGYIVSWAEENEQLLISIDDSYRQDALRLDILLDSQDLPLTGEIYWQGRRILTIRVENFCFL